MTTSLASSIALENVQAAPCPAATVTAVLDTNVALDLLLFLDQRVQALQQALTGQSLRWIATEPMLDELSRVLRRAALAHWGHDSDQVMAEARRLCQGVAGCAETDSRVPHCTDPDDQMFIDLAWRWPAKLLFSRDRAVLRLARPARAQGLWIGTPERWPATGPGQQPGQQEQRRPKPPL